MIFFSSLILNKYKHICQINFLPIRNAKDDEPTFPTMPMSERPIRKQGEYIRVQRGYARTFSLDKGTCFYMSTKVRDINININFDTNKRGTH